MEREVGGGIGMGKTCKLKDVSFQCMTIFTTNKKNKINKIKGNLCLLMFYSQREDLCFHYNLEKFQLRHLLVKIGEKSLPCSPSY